MEILKRPYFWNWLKKQGGGKIDPSTEEYEVLRYIESTGTQYVDSAIKGSGKTGIGIDFEVVNDMNGHIFGSRNASNVKEFACYKHTNYFRNDYNTVANLQFPTTNMINERFTLFKYWNSCFLKGGDISLTYSNSVNNSSDFSGEYDIALFGINENGVFKSETAIRLYSCIIIENDEIVRDFIPVRRKSDNVNCLYDKVTKQYFENEGEGVFLGGI